MEYSNQAKKFVNGLRGAIKDTPYEQIGMVILSQWIFESGHFKSKLCVEFNNPGGIQWRSGSPLNAIAADYTDWEGKTRKHFKLENPEDFAGLYLWFISGDGRFNADKNPYIAATRYVTETPKDQVDPGTWLKLLARPYVASIEGIKREDYKTQAEYDEAVDEKYTQKVVAISKREATRDLYDHRWLANTSSMFHKPNDPIRVDDCHVQDDWPEWLLGQREGVQE